jgi:hypothetical protein
MTFADLIASAMSGRGRMHNAQIYLRVKRTARNRGKRLSPHWRATVRNTLQRHTKGGRKYRPPGLFIHHDYNTWECRE